MKKFKLNIILTFKYKTVNNGNNRREGLVETFQQNNSSNHRLNRRSSLFPFKNNLFH